jgi:hypothetical protein
MPATNKLDKRNKSVIERNANYLISRYFLSNTNQRLAVNLNFYIDFRDYLTKTLYTNFLHILTTCLAYHDLLGKSLRKF